MVVSNLCPNRILLVSKLYTELPSAAYIMYTGINSGRSGLYPPHREEKSMNKWTPLPKGVFSFGDTRKRARRFLLTTDGFTILRVYIQRWRTDYKLSSIRELGE